MEPALSEPPRRLVTVVLVTWNSAEYLPRCLEGIASQTWLDLEIIAVDNASADGSVGLLEAFRKSWVKAQQIDPSGDRSLSDPRPAPPLRLIRNADNAGFARAVNQAIAIAGGEFIQLVNPDAYLHAGYIERLVAALDDAGREFGAATGTLIRGEGAAIHPTDVIDSKGIRMTRSGRHFDIGQGRRDGEETRGLREHAEEGSARAGRPGRRRRLAQPSSGSVVGRSRLPVEAVAGRPSNQEIPVTSPPTARWAEVFGVSGAAAMYRRSFIDDVAIDGHFFDEDFFAYREDADVAWRGRLFGWRALHASDAVAIHVRTVTPERRRDLSVATNLHSVKNRFLLRLKNEGPYLALRNALFEIPRDLVAIAAVLTIERSSLPGLLWVWRNRRSVLAKRRQVQKRRRVSDRALAGWFR